MDPNDPRPQFTLNGVCYRVNWTSKDPTRVQKMTEAQRQIALADLIEGVLRKTDVYPDALAVIKRAKVA